MIGSSRTYTTNLCVIPFFTQIYINLADGVTLVLVTQKQSQTALDKNNFLSIPKPSLLGSIHLCKHEFCLNCNSH